MLRLDHIRTGYRAGDAVVDDASLAIAPGEIVALIGANGAGKSTIARAISGLLPLFGGQILYEDRKIDNLSARDRVAAGIVHVPDGRHVFGSLSVLDNLKLGSYAVANTAPIQEKIAEMCRRFPDLQSRLGSPAGNLSGGQQQMVAIARGLMGDPKVLVLDEPSLGLSPLLVEQIFGMITELRDQGLSILLAEQNARMALSIADRGYVIELGRIVQEGPAHALLKDEGIARRYLGMADTVDGAGASEVQAMAQRLDQALGPAQAPPIRA